MSVFSRPRVFPSRYVRPPIRSPKVVLLLDGAGKSCWRTKTVPKHQRVRRWRVENDRLAFRTCRGSFPEEEAGENMTTGRVPMESSIKKRQNVTAESYG